MKKLLNVLKEMVGYALSKNIILAPLLILGIVLAIVLGVGVAVGLVGALMAIPAVIVMALWNYALAPVLGMSPIGFWFAFAAVWVLSIVGRLLHK
jgi:hypothetical protein